jgi:V-type H+-transporting ATPase subunit E
MSQKEADRQIEQMIAFIKQEAKEKAEEIMVKTESACNAEKLNLDMQLTRQIAEEAEKRKKDRAIQKKIERSKLVNNARLASMRERDERMRVLKKETLSRLAEIPKHPKYVELLRLLITESLMTLCEKVVYVQCRKEDEALVTAQIEPAVHSFVDIMGKASGRAVTVKLTLDKENYLPPGPVEGSEAASCCGGVVLYAKNKTIICRNTLDARLDIAFDNLTPQLRGLLFGFRAPPANEGKHQEEEHKH